MMVPSFILPLLFIACSHAAGDHRSGQRWARTTQSFKLGVIKSVTNSGPNDWLGNWDWAMNAWSQSKVLDLVTVRGETDFQTRLDCPAKEGYIRVCNNDYGRTSWRGMARWSFQLYDGRPGLIYQCTVRLNDRTDTDYEKKWLSHELGHCLGLDHTSTSGQSDNSVMDYSVAPASIGPSQKDLDVLESMYSDIDWFDSAAPVVPVTCPASKLKQVAAACSCDGPSPGFGWSNEQEYILCVDFIIEDTGCNKQDVIDLAKCIPFDLPTASPTTKAPTKSPSRSPTPRPTQLPTTRAPITVEPSELPSARPIRGPGERSPSNGGNTPTSEPSDFPTRMPSPIPTSDLSVPTDFPTANPSSGSIITDDSCTSILLAKLAQECDCFGPRQSNGQPWAVVDEYLQCVDFAARNTPCPVQALIDRAGCLPFPNNNNPTPPPTTTPTAPPTLAPTIRGSAERLSTSSPSANPDYIVVISPTIPIIPIPITTTRAPTRAPATSTPTRVPTKSPTTQSPTKVPTMAPTKNPTAECSRAEFARVSLQCSCSGRKNKKPWKHQREYERCVKKALETSQCTFQSVMDATRCVVPARGGAAKKTKKAASTPTNSNNNNPNLAAASCSQYSNENGCKQGKCKWSKKENQCQIKNRRLRQLDMETETTEAQNHHHQLPTEETKEHHNLRASFGQTYSSSSNFYYSYNSNGIHADDENSVCQTDRESFGVIVPEEAVLVHSHPNSCRYAIQTGNQVDVIEVLL